MSIYVNLCQFMSIYVNLCQFMSIYVNLCQFRWFLRTWDELKQPSGFRQLSPSLLAQILILILAGGLQETYILKPYVYIYIIPVYIIVYI